MMTLKVLKTSSHASTDQLIRLFHQSQLEWSRHLGEETELDFGRLISNPHLPQSTAANCLLEARLLADLTVSQVMKSISDRAVRCCTLNPSVSPEQTAPLAEALLSQNWVAMPLDILYLHRPAAPIATIVSDIKIIPARASYRHYQQLMTQLQPSTAEAAMLHLDDSHFEVLLALKGGEPIGSIGVLTSGEVGTIREWHVAPAQRHPGIDLPSVDRLLLDRALEICSRGVLRHVMIGLPDSPSTALDLCQATGFIPIGKWASFWKDSCKSAGLFA